MNKALEVQIKIIRQRLSPSAVRALKRLETFDWVLFTSKHAATFFAQELRQKRIRMPHEVRIAAVGPTTAKTLRDLGFPVHIVPERFTGNDLIQSLGNVKGARILFPRSAIALSDTVRTLRARGARVTVLPLYTTKTSPLSRLVKRAILAGAYEQLICKSPSGVRSLMSQFTRSQQRSVRKVPVQCIGSTTAQAARAAGFRKISIRAR